MTTIPLIEATAGSAFSRSLKEWALSDLWNQSSMRACFAAGGADLGAYYKRETCYIPRDKIITIFLGGCWKTSGCVDRIQFSSLVQVGSRKMVTGGRGSQREGTGMVIFVASSDHRIYRVSVLYKIDKLMSSKCKVAIYIIYSYFICYRSLAIPQRDLVLALIRYIDCPSFPTLLVACHLVPYKSFGNKRSPYETALPLLTQIDEHVIDSTPKKAQKGRVAWSCALE